MVKASSVWFWFLVVSICFSPGYSTAFVYFSKAFSNGEYVNVACFIICLWWYFLACRIFAFIIFFPDYKANVFAASLLISCCSFSFLILTLFVMISFYILSRRFFLKREGLSDARVASINKNLFFECIFCKVS